MPSYELPKTYDFQKTERHIYNMWESNGYFQPSNDPNQPGFNPEKKPFVISIPPPNVTGELHLGHAIFVSVEDLMIRYHRMKGEPTLWVPGSDHAGIATQLQVEKALSKENLSREQVGRDEFVQRSWAWKEKYGGIIIDQIRRLGASCDWSRLRFTLDEGLSRAVREAFVRLHEKGLIYRGPRLINWSPGLKTAVSDLEVEYYQEPGTMYYFKYMLVNPSKIDSSNPEYIPVATTRPETILGDTAVAVHPDDTRYHHLIGKNAIVPIIGREIPIIADSYVDPEFGTGALKITPGHDPNDYEIGLRHQLDVICVLDEEARINQFGGPYVGLDRFVARDQLWEDMKKNGLVIKEEPYMINIPRSQRGGEIIEPMISTQWFVKIKPLADVALKAVQENRIRIIPERFEKVYMNWLENIQDWCISRQLWWGHRIPVWYCKNCGEMIVSRDDPQNCPNCQNRDLEQDPDVLDTWFSSGLWPFSTLGWPLETADMKYFYPTTVMETGYDILFFWVARMIMMGLEFTGDIPFEIVYLHGLFRDELGRKMSKTIGNMIDPLTVMDQFGTDALRFTLLVGSTPGNDMNLSLKRVEASRNYVNKIWNAGRFTISAIAQSPQKPLQEPQWTLADSWIWARTQALIRDVNRLFESFQFGEAGRQIYEFFWSEFADWYIEVAKLQIAEGGDRAFYTTQTLVQVLDLCLRMLHPFTPFVTEELWGHLKMATITCNFLGWNHMKLPDALIIASWPDAKSPESWENIKIEGFNLIQEIVRSIRNLRSEKGIPLGKHIPALFITSTHQKLIEDQLCVIAKLSQLDLDRTEIRQSAPVQIENYITLVESSVEIFLPLAGMIDQLEEIKRLGKELEDTRKQIQRLEELLASPFSIRAPDDIVNKEQIKLTKLLDMANKLESQLNALKQ